MFSLVYIEGFYKIKSLNLNNLYMYRQHNTKERIWGIPQKIRTCISKYACIAGLHLKITQGDYITTNSTF